MIDGGLELMNAVWPAMHQVLAVRRDKMPALEKLHETRGVLPHALHPVRVQEGWASYWNWLEFEKNLFHTRSMSNMLTPPGLVLRHDYATPPLTEHIPDARVHPMPNRPQSWIKTERGFRCLHLDETARGWPQNAKRMELGHLTFQPWPPEPNHQPLYLGISLQDVNQ
jgi:hypothetical protein